MTLWVMLSKIAPFGRLAAGVLVPSTLTTIVPSPIIPAVLIAALSTLDTLTLAAIVQQLQPDYFVTS